MEILGVVCALTPIFFVALTVYTFVKLRRANRPPAEVPRAAGSLLCPRCQTPRSDNTCTVCNWPGSSTRQSTRRALESIRQRINSLAAAGLLPPTARERLLASVGMELDQFAAAQPTPATADLVQADLVDDSAHTASPLRAEHPPAPIPLAPQPATESAIPSAAAQAHRDVHGRAQRYEESLVAPRAAADNPPVAPPAPRARLADLLAGFMEEKNVRWGELVGGLLIVGGSIALVISFWSQIASQPLLKFGLFNGIVAALFALGFYTDKKWKLPTTSRGVLMIATLLVPLNFLSIAAVTINDVSPLVIAGELFSIALFGGLVYGAGRTITPLNPLALAVGVLGAAVAQLAIRRWAPADTDLNNATLYLLCGWPLACHAGAVAANILRLRRVELLTEPQIHELLRLLGLTAFAAIPPCGMLLSLSGDAPATLGRLAPLVSLAGMPALAAGLLLWRRLRESALSGLRTAGTAVAMLGSAIMLGAIPLAWPDPALLVGVAAIDFVVLTLVAVAFELPAAHLAAAVALSLGSLIVVHVARGELSWTQGSTATTLRALSSAVSGNALVGLAVLYAAAAAGWQRWGRRRDAGYYLVAAGAVAAASLLLVTLFGFRQLGDPHGATFVYALYAAGALAGSAAMARGLAARGESDVSAQIARLPVALAWFGSLLTALALVQGLVYRPLPPAGLVSPWTTAAILHALTMLGVVVLVRWVLGSGAGAPQALLRSAIATSLFGALLVTLDAWGLGLPRVDPLACASHALLLAVAWLVAAYVSNSALLFAAGQAGLFAAATLAGIDLASRQAWWETSPQIASDPRLWQVLGCIWIGLCLLWTALRIAAARLAPTDCTNETTDRRHGLWATTRFLEPGWPAVDHVALGAAVFVVVTLASYAAWPGVAQELSPESAVARLAQRWPQLVTQENAHRIVPATAAFELDKVPHAPAMSADSWLLLALTAAALVVGLWDKANGWRILGLLVVTAAISPLGAARWETQVSAASALRWLSTGYFLLGSIGIWSRTRLAAWGKRLGWRAAVQAPEMLASNSIAALALLASAPLVAMGGYVVSNVIASAPIDPQTQELTLLLGILGASLALVAGLLMIVGRVNRRSAAGPSEWSQWATPAGSLILVLGAAPLVATLLYVVTARLAGDPIVGPDPDSLFVAMGQAVNYCLPAALVTLVLVGYAIRERSAPFAFVAGLVANLTATLGYLFTTGSNFTTQDPQLWTDLGLVNALVAALCGLAWYSSIRWWTRQQANRPAIAPLLVAQAGLALALLLSVLGAASFNLVLDPAPPQNWLLATAGGLGLAAWLATLGLALWLSVGRSRVATTALVAVGLWSCGTLLGSAAVRWDTGNWLALHVLLAARIVGPWLLIGALWWWYRREVLAWDDRPRRAATFWSSLLVAPVLVISLRLVGSTAGEEPWWSSAGVFSTALLAAFLAVWSCRRWFLYAASGLVVLTAAIWYPRSPFWPAAPAAGNAELYTFVYAALVALALPVAAWVAIELRAIRPRVDRLGESWSLPVHRPAAWLSLSILGLVTAVGIATDYAGGNQATTSLLGSVAVAATALAALACLWDARARESVMVVYLVGLALVGVFLDALDLVGDRLLWTGTIALGAFNLATCYLWSRRRGWQSFAASLQLPLPTESQVESGRWIRSLSTLLVAVTVALVYWLELFCPERELKISAGFAAIFQSFALGMLAEGSHRSRVQRDALLVGLFGAVAFSWAFVPPDTPLPLLDRSVATCVALVATAIFYALGIAKLPVQATDWVAAAQRVLPLTVTALVVSVLAVLGQEVMHYLSEGAVPLAWSGILAVAVTLAALFGAALAAALLPGRDPLGLSERGRMLYIYAAEVILALAFLHVRVTMPWLFQGLFLAYWPLVVMAIAYLGVGLAEWFGRRRQKILAEPLERTGVLLPLLPVIGFWFVQNQTNYSLLLLVVGGLYTALAVTRKSIGFGLLAALCANGGLWHYLHQAGGVSLLDHPQLWLIPPALCVLAAAYLNRDRLTDNQMTTVRYLTSMTIYLSSTADIFLQGVAQAPWLPLVLAALAIAGVFAGILLRVRAFLFLGTSFLVLSILTMIWHAAVDLDQTWIWWASLIVAGVAIIALFAVFEKRRQDVLRVMEQLKQWEG